MSSKRLSVVVNGRPQQIESDQEVIDFASIRIGTSNLQISEDTGVLSTNGAKLKVADGVAANEVSSRGQLNTVQSSLQSLISTNESNANSRVSKAGDTMTGELQMSSNAIRGVPLTPASDDEVSSKKYVDALFQGVRPKDRVRFIVLTNVAGSFASGTLTTALTSLVSDGVTAANGDRVLLAGQSSGLQNGIYDIAGVGTAIVLTRSIDADESSNVKAGMSTWISEGTVNGDQGWALTTNDPIVLNTTSLSFTQTSGLGQVVAGNGLSKAGNQIDVETGDGVKIAGDQVTADYAETLTNDNAGAITSGQLVYLKTNGNVDLATAALASNDVILGIVQDASIAATASGKVVVRRGAKVGGFSSLTPGKLVYVHNTTAGLYTQDPTTIALAKYRHTVGRAISTTQIMFDPQYESVTNVYDFDSAGATTFLVGETLVSGQRIEALVNGKEARVGAAHDFQVSGNNVVFNYTIPSGAWVRIRVYK